MAGEQLSQAGSMARPKRWPLVNTLSNRQDNFYKDARLVNAYAEKDKLTGEYRVEKRPGFSPSPIYTPPSGPGQGIFAQPVFIPAGPVEFFGVCAQFVYIANNQAYYTLFGPGATSTQITFAVQISNLLYANSATKARFLAVPGSATTNPIILFGGGQTSIPGGPKAYWVSTSGVSGLPPYVPAITTGVLTPGINGFPTSTVPGFVYLDGYVYVMDIYGAIWETTTQNAIVNWSVNYIAAINEGDLAVFLAKQLSYVIAIKQWSMQIFYDAGNTTGSSLSPLAGAVYNFGCLHADTIAELDGVWFFATQSKQGTSKIVRIENLQVKFVSTPAVERILDLDVGDQWASMAFQHAGHTWYIITNTTDNVTMVYDIGEDLWYNWTDFQANYFPVIDRCLSFAGMEWHQMLATGQVYQLDGDYIYPTDYGNVVPVDIYTPNFDDGIDRIKFLSQMRFNADQTNGSKLYLRSSEDDYQTWTNMRMVDLSQKRPILNDEGSFYRRAYHFRHFAPTPFRLSSVDLQMDIGVL